MGKRLKQWKWPIGAAGAVVLFIGVQAVRTNPAYDAAVAAKQSDTSTSIDIASENGQDGADQWFDRHERRGRPGSGGTFEQNGSGSSSGIDGGSSGDTGGQFGQAPNSGGGGRSSTGVS